MHQLNKVKDLIFNEVWYQQHMFLMHTLPFPFPFVMFIPDHPILQTLETRTGDKMAQDFVKKQKLRISNS